jgi:hypothetical protein
MGWKRKWKKRKAGGKRGEESELGRKSSGYIDVTCAWCLDHPASIFVFESKV